MRFEVRQSLSCLQGEEGELTSAVKSEDAATDECVGLFTPDKKRGTVDGAGRAANLAARRGTVCGEVGRVPRFPQLTVLSLYPCQFSNPFVNI